MMVKKASVFGKGAALDEYFMGLISNIEENNTTYVDPIKDEVDWKL